MVCTAWLFNNCALGTLKETCKVHGNSKNHGTAVTARQVSYCKSTLNRKRLEKNKL